MTDTDSRRRLRNRLYLVGLLPSLLLLALSLRVALLLHHESAGMDAYDRGEPRVAAAEFEANRVLNLIERWVAPFDQGASLHRAGAYAEAVTAYEVALGLAPEEWVCAVRNNLALAHEGIGDAAADDGQREDAETAWLAGREVLEPCLSRESGSDAGSDSSDPDRSDDSSADSSDSSDSSEDSSAADSGSGAGAERGAAVDAARPEDRTHAVVIDRRLADKLDTGELPPDPEEPEEADGDVEERKRRLEDRSRDALERRRRQEHERQERQAEERNTTEGEPPVPQW